MGTCLRWALDNREEYGVWGMTSGRTRRRIWRWIREDYVSTDQVVADIQAGRVDLYEQDLDVEDEAV